MESNDIPSVQFPEETADDSSKKATKRPAGCMALTPGKRQKVGVPPTVNSEESSEFTRVLETKWGQ